MEEYYLRVDYASRNFTTITGTNGANTDRGKIYIRFGKPTEINRSSDDHGYIIETWTYNDTQRKFVFVDKKGTGKHKKSVTKGKGKKSAEDASDEEENNQSEDVKSNKGKGKQR